MKIQGSDGFTGKFYLTFEGEIIQFVHRFFQKKEEVMLRGQHYPDTKRGEDIMKRENHRTIFPMNIDAESLIK